MVTSHNLYHIWFAVPSPCSLSLTKDLKTALNLTSFNPHSKHTSSERNANSYWAQFNRMLSLSLSFPRYFSRMHWISLQMDYLRCTQNVTDTNTPNMYHTGMVWSNDSRTFAILQRRRCKTAGTLKMHNKLTDFSIAETDVRLILRFSRKFS